MTDLDPPENPLDFIFREQLQSFLANLSVNPVPQIQDTRAGTVAFIATFAPEAVGAASRTLLFNARTEIMTRRSFSTVEWWRIPFIDVAAFSLAGGDDTLGTIMGNLSHGKLNLRTHLFSPLGLVAPKIDLGETFFVNAMSRNFEIGHFLNDKGICVLLASKTAPERKRGILERWSAVAWTEGDRADLSKALAGGYLPNASLLYDYFTISLHLAECLFNAPKNVLTLFSTPPSVMLERAKTHPLMKSAVSLNG